MRSIAALARAQRNEERFQRRVRERKQTRIRLACDGDRPIDRGKYELWELVVWGRKMYGED